jgi:hypothetical protein
MMRIEVVTVSIGYGDFLAATLRENLPLIDNIVVVTSPDDQETIAVCRQHSVHYIASEDHKRGGDFNKARLIQRGLDQIGGRDWILHLDADIVLPRPFKRLLDWADLQEHKIYGADRCNCVGWDAWQKIRAAGGWDPHSYECYQKFPADHRAGARWVSRLHGYCPIGAFQLLHGTAMLDRGMHVRAYPFEHGTAARTDIQFSLQWDRKERELLGEVIVLHLESEPAALGANWCGRTTRRFGPEPAAARRAASMRGPS